MAKFLDRDGVSTLWTRVRQLVAQCINDKLASIPKQQILVPLMNYGFDAQEMTFSGHSALTLGGSNTYSGTISLNRGTLPANIRAIALQGIKSPADNTCHLEKVSAIRWNNNAQTYEVDFYSAEAFSLPADAISIEAVIFYQPLLNKNTVCVLTGDCSSSGGGDDSSGGDE